MMKDNLWLLAAFLLAVGRFFAEADLIVSVQIDGHSRLNFSSGDNATTRSEIVWDHLAYSRPGTAGGIFPTVLNGYNWFPTWPDTPNGTPGLSFPLTNGLVRFSTNTVTLVQLSGRTAVTIVQQPDPTNAFTLIVDFDDSAPPGEDQYKIRLNGVSFTPEPRVSIYVSAVNITWPTEPDRLYQLQYTTPGMSGWSNLGGPVQGTGEDAVFTDSAVGQRARLYRVIVP